jgi:ATP/maltotriose-dependent transcriptional regulator MalT
MHMGLAAAWCHGLLALVALHRDEIAVAEDAIAMVDESLAHNAPLLGFDLAVLAHARLAEARGDVASAFEQLLASWEFLEAADAYTMLEVLAPDVVRLAVEVGETERVERVVVELERAAQIVTLPSWRGSADVARGRVHDDAAALARGASLLLESPRLLDAAEALTAAGLAAHRHGDDEHAHSLLVDAIRIYDASGARRDRARAASWLRDTGGRVPRAVPPATQRRLLSPAEEEVTRLVLAGLSNPEIAERLFVSRRTVESHLRRIFSKLAVSSRVELAVWAKESSSRPQPRASS